MPNQLTIGRAACSRDDGLTAPTLANTPLSEIESYGDSSKPGKLITTNDGDKNANGIPDFADGFNVASDQGDDTTPPTTAEGAGFVPITVLIPPWIDATKAKLRFTYSGSNPSDLQRTGSGTDADPYVYTPADGAMRLWLKDESQQRDPTSAGADGGGGDWIKPDEDFPLSKLAPGNVIYVEALTPSAALGDDTITCTVENNGDINDPKSVTGGVHLTAFNLQYVQVNSDGSTTPVDQPQLSQPSPVINFTSYEFTNVHFSADYTQILADVHVAGTVTDAASDLIKGNDGTISSLDLSMNGSEDPLADIQVNVTKSDGADSLLHPFAFSGSFDQTITGVEVDPGSNLLDLTATNAYGFSGYAEASVNVSVDPQNVDITLSDDPYTTSATQITITYSRNGQTIFSDILKPMANQPDLWGNTLGDTFLDTSTAGGAPESMQLTDTTREIDQIITFTRDPATGKLSGTFVPDPEQQNDYRNFIALVSGATQGSSSGGGDLYPFMIQLNGPMDLKDTVKQINIDQSKFNVLPYQNKLVFSGSDALQGHPSLLLINLKPGPGGLASLLNPNAQPRRDGIGNFAKGVGRGLYDTGVSAYAGFKAIGHGLLWLGKNLEIRVDGDPLAPVSIRLKDDASNKIGDALYAGWQVASKIGGVMWELFKKTGSDELDAYQALVMGDNPTLVQLGAQYAKVGEALAELFQHLLDVFESVDDYTFGWIEGRIIGEALTILATEGAGEVAELSKAALLEKLLPRLSAIKELAPVMENEEFVASMKELIEGLQTTKMCFTAGTLVHTSEGLRTIESLRVGDLVLARDEVTGEQGYRSVVSTVTTRPTQLYHVSCQTENGDHHMLSCTGEHPFYVGSRACFVPARELQPGDALTLAEAGKTATVASIIKELSIEGSPFTTYNVEVAEYHTYFVAPLGVWVHNVGGLCDKVFSLYTKIVKEKGLQNQPWEAFTILLQRTAQVSEKIDEALPKTVAEVMQKVYQNALRANGTMDLTKIPTVAAMRKVIARRGTNALIDVHHTAVQAWAKILVKGISQEELDDMPGLLLRTIDHRINSESESAFHAILQRRMPYFSTVDKATILTNLEEAYVDWDPQLGPLVWKAVRTWLRTQGVN